MSEYSNLNDVTNDLIIKYDSKFNETYNKILNVNSSIMNKEELIIKENDDIKRKDGTIIALEILVVFIFLFAGLLIAYGMKQMTFSTLIYSTIGLIIVYAITTYYYVNTYINGVSFSDKLQALEIQMKNYDNNSLEEDYGLVCPTSCPTVSNPPPTSTGITGYERPTLRTDSQLDVWQYGDLPTDLYTSSKVKGKKFYNNPKGIPNYEKENGEKPAFDTTFPTSTYYKCKWLGGNTNNGGLPNIEKNKYSSIPCDFRPNFEEVGRYVCLKNPNNLSKPQFSQYCDDVSNKIHSYLEQESN